MAWKRNILVVANITATSDELLDALKSRAADEPTAFTLVVPATTASTEGKAAAGEKVAAAVDRLRGDELKASGLVGDCDPLVAVSDVWDPKQFDEIVVCTLPTGISKWLQSDLPHRVEKLTGAPVTHLVAMPPRPKQETTKPKPREHHGVMTPLTVLGWGGPAGEHGAGH
jgi:hypothetical protein